MLLAREAIDQYRPHRRADDPCFVIGSIGPTPDVRESPQEVRAIYRPQIEALVNTGIDALLLETFTSLVHVSAVLEVVHNLSTPVPVVVHMALHQRADDSWDLDPLLFAKTAADMRVHILGVNCCAPWEAQAFLDTVSELRAGANGPHSALSCPMGVIFGASAIAI